MPVKSNPIKAKAKRICEECGQRPELRRILFDASPIPIWEEDFSEVKKIIDDLKRKGVKDFKKYFEDHSEIVARCAELIKVIDVNKAALRLYGAKSRQHLLQNLPQVFSLRSYDVFREELVALANGKNKFESDAENKTLKGKPIWIHLILWVIPKYEQNLSKVFVFTSDRTELIQSRESLRREQKRLRLIIDRVPVILWSVDTDLRITMSLGMGVSGLGLKPNELVGKSLYEYLGTKDRNYPPVAAVFKALAGKTADWELDFHGRNFECHAEPIYDDFGKISGVAAFAYDVTEFKTTERKLNERNQDLEKMNQAMVGREMKMVELKDEVDSLKARLAALSKGVV